MSEQIAIIFDMDGVIVDNIRYHTEAWKQFCSRYNFTLTDEEFNSQLNGKTAKDSLEYFFKRSLPSQEIQKYSEEKEEIYRDLYRPHLNPTPGLEGFSASMKKEKVLLGVATSAPTINLDFTLDNLNLRRFFDAIVDSSFVTRGKPDPEIYLKAAALLKVQPGRAIVIEDSLAGIKSGLNAGMKVIGITTTHKAEELENTHLIIKDFRELNYEQINSLVN